MRSCFECSESFETGVLYHGFWFCSVECRDYYMTMEHFKIESSKLKKYDNRGEHVQ